MEDDLKRKKNEKERRPKKNGRQTNQPNSTYLAVTPLEIDLVKAVDKLTETAMYVAGIVHLLGAEIHISKGNKLFINIGASSPDIHELR